MKFKLRVWRQKSSNHQGNFEEFLVDEVSPESSFLEMLDELNLKLRKEGREPIAFDSDCREGICGTCGFLINGRPHGPLRGVTTCQLHMRNFKDGDTLVLEPFRGGSFRVLKDLVVDRSGLDRVLQKGGYISVAPSAAPEANSILVPKAVAEEAFDYATCIGCGACVAACPNGSAMFFVAAKAAHLNFLPQGKPEAKKRITGMLDQSLEEGFGACSNHGECEAACPKKIKITSIVKIYRSVFRGDV